MQLYPSRNSILAEFARKKGSKDKKRRKKRYLRSAQPSLTDNLFGTTTAGKLVRGGLLMGGVLVAGRRFIPRKPLPDLTINKPIGNLPSAGKTSGRSYVKQESYRSGYKPNFVEQPVPPPKPLNPNPSLGDPPDISKVNVTDDVWADPPKVIKTNNRRTVNKKARDDWRKNKGRNNSSKKR